MESRIKHRGRDIIIFLSSLLGLTFFYRTSQSLRRSLVRVLVFHDVQDKVWFEKTIAYLAQYCRLITPEMYAQGKFDTYRINVLITFDDGYASWVTTCLPILSHYGVKAVFFINSGLIDVSENPEAQKRYVHDRLLLSPRNTLSWEGVKHLSENGHTIGGHTVTHARLSELQEHMQREEIIRDKVRIEAVLEKEITMFAYPFGQSTDYTSATKKIVSDIGYTSAFTTESGFVYREDTFALSRLCIEDNLSPSHVRRWVGGGYDIFQKLKSLCVR